VRERKGKNRVQERYKVKTGQKWGKNRRSSPAAIHKRRSSKKEESVPPENICTMAGKKIRLRRVSDHRSNVTPIGKEVLTAGKIRGGGGGRDPHGKKNITSVATEKRGQRPTGLGKTGQNAGRRKKRKKKRTQNDPIQASEQKR